MPGIVGLITRMPREAGRTRASRDGRGSLHEKFYVTGAWMDESLGVYVGSDRAKRLILRGDAP